MAENLSFLRVKGKEIVDESGRKFILKGVAIGGWLMMEGYMSAGRNIAEKAFRTDFEKALGKDVLEDFTKSFRDTFICEEDFAIIKRLGANCVRIPFNYRLVEFEERPFSLNEEGLRYLDQAVGWCEKHELYCILDMHAAPGAQNPDWHSDCVGKPDLFTNETNRDRYFRLWHFLAGRYKDTSCVAGYDVLNEPVVGFNDERIIKDLYERVTREIRDVDTKHIIFLEGNFWAQRITFLGKPKDDNTAYSIHAYPPTEFTFNLHKELHYPGRARYGINWNKESFGLLAMPYQSFIKKHNVHLYVGEFGVNARNGYYGENKWVDDILNIFKANNLSWTYWTYKTVANSIYPDGIYRYLGNPAWVNRQGPVYGWETFASLWQKEKGRIISSWRTENFTRNDKLVSVLRKYF